MKENRSTGELLDKTGIKRGGLSGSTLKLLAIATMLIDHVGAGIIGRMLYPKTFFVMNFLERPDVAVLFITYMIMRFIGRIAFPIFIFLLIEGMRKTRNEWKYAMRLGAFALISEIPFDLAFNGKVLEFTYQNVFFTLFIGLLTIIAIDKVWVLLENVLLKVCVMLPIAALGAWVAESLHTDYGAIGIACIVVIYVFSFSKVPQIVAGCIVFIWEVTAPLAFIPIGFYNGKRGLKLKYVFYIFYPLHLLLIYLIAVVMGIAKYPAM